MKNSFNNFNNYNNQNNSSLKKSNIIHVNFVNNNNNNYAQGQQKFINLPTKTLQQNQQQFSPQFNSNNTKYE